MSSAAARSFRCRLITPVAQILDEQATSAVVPAWDGLFGVLPNRAPIVAKLGLGELKINFADSDKGRGGSRSFLVEDGFVQMVDNKLTILAARAIPTESISESEAQAELREADSRRPEKAADSQRITADKARARAKIRLAQKVGGRGI
jgi:F-type H+-transporting ATPase subunit epsilon